ncbi:fructosamine kinase family protein [Actinotignum urinale]|uniref:Fructosamine kinase family protein n=1 Tax=Actinotignum urinale TaxID=190146 RepID=A0AAW9HTQ0_9ACTO|nr:fructosamine kinase family protein [Actinotignum urinale]MDY5154448.1 fructosamine kinase family protein [Actinotignum urinale]
MEFTKSAPVADIVGEALSLRELAEATPHGGAFVVPLLSSRSEHLRGRLREPFLTTTRPTREAARTFGARLARTHAYAPQGSRSFGCGPANPHGDTYRLGSWDLSVCEGTSATEHSSGDKESAKRPVIAQHKPEQPAADSHTSTHYPIERNASEQHLTDNLLRTTSPQPLRFGEFYSRMRILPYLPSARDNGSVDAKGARVIERLCSRLEDGDFDSPQPGLIHTSAALIHGDLWSGNVMWIDASSVQHLFAKGTGNAHPSERDKDAISATTDDNCELGATKDSGETCVAIEGIGGALGVLTDNANAFCAPTDSDSNFCVPTDGVMGILIDPVAHGGHAETDLATLTVFSTPYVDEIYAGYNSVSALAEGWEERVGLHRLHCLAIHASMFGGSYGRQFVRQAEHYV